jgi:hypothetical protein
MQYLVMYPISDTPVLVVEADSQNAALEVIDNDPRLKGLEAWREGALCEPLDSNGNEAIVCLILDGYRRI